MGGFFLHIDRLNEGIESKNFIRANRLSETIFRKRGLELGKTIVRDGFTLQLFKKVYAAQVHLMEFENNDFICYTGTLIYNRKTGNEALGEFYSDFISGTDYDQKLTGEYCMIIFTNNKLYLIKEYLDCYPAYTESKRRYYSSSFLNVFYQLENFSISRNELYEFVLLGLNFSSQTFIKEIVDLENGVEHELLSGKFRKRNFGTGVDLRNHTRKESLEIVSNQLKELAGIYKNLYGNSITTALSGGYDSRLIVAMLRSVGITPEIYVYGSNDHMDVKIAKEIAIGEHFDLDHRVKASNTEIPDESYYQHLETHFYFNGGVNNTSVFDNGSSRLLKLDRASKAELQLNGVLGEIYRNGAIPFFIDRAKLSYHKFFTARYDSFDYSIFGAAFDKKEYRSTIIDKIKYLLNSERDYLNREEFLSLLPVIRSKFAKANNETNQLLTGALFPYASPVLVKTSYSLSFAWKRYGMFQADLLRILDPKLANYNSQYGYNFASKPALKYRIKNQMKAHVPVAIRPYLRSKKVTDIEKGELFIPEFLTGELVKRACLRDYIDYTKIDHEEKLARVLSVEILLQKIFKP